MRHHLERACGAVGVVAGGRCRNRARADVLCWLSPSLAGMLAVLALMVYPLTLLGTHVLAVAGGVFVLAWIGQFVGHMIEGRKPSFFEDVKFLLVGPAWLLGFIYRRAGIRY